MSELEGFFKQGLLWLADPPAGSQASDSPSLCPSLRCSSAVSSLVVSSSVVSSSAQFGLDAIDNELPLGGLASGALHEWASSRDILPCSILALLASNMLKKAMQALPHSPEQQEAKKFAVWIGRDIWPTPYLLEQTMQYYASSQDIHENSHGAAKTLLPHCLFIDPPNEKLKLWAIELALRSPAVAAVVADCKRMRFSTSRKFALAARKSGALGLLIRDKKALSAPSAAFSRWHIEPLPSASSSPCFKLQLLKCKGAQPRIASWNIELREGVCAYEPNQQTLSLHLLSPVVSRSAAAPPEETQRRLARQ
jgi:protein ImuA